MDDHLLVKIYRVGFGDCIYVQIPDNEDTFTMLIDCGTSGPADPLEEAVTDICNMLPRLKGHDRRLDLMVVTHPHADHIKGFNPKWFKKIKIKRIWLPVFMNSQHPQAKKMRAFQDMAGKRADDLLNRKGLSLAPSVKSLLKRSAWNICNTEALHALRTGLAEDSGIHPEYPLYVARDLAKRQSSKEQQRYKTSFEQDTTCFRGFQEPGTCLRLLAPEWDIDKWYLGQGSFDSNAFADRYLFETEVYKARSETIDKEGAGAIRAEGGAVTAADRPRNISAKDFQQLQSRLLYSGLAFSQTDDSLKNNTSVVLLLEWRGRRLLFAGDAEWQDSGVKEDRRNSNWDVMLDNPKVKSVLLETLDLLKVGHHGSHNGSPFKNDGEEQILKSILSADRTHVVVSTVSEGKHAKENSVPYPELMRTLGKLACNSRPYPDSPEQDLRRVKQPQRTDLEPLAPGEKVHCVKVTLFGK
jgi:beta-lactamase superfamily II metal-dependent hydrolase